VSVSPPRPGTGPALSARFRAHIQREGVLRSGDRVVVAVSGGRDSMALLHLFRFTADLGNPRLVVAHLDHAMRPSSAADAAWVTGVCRAWDLPFRTLRCDPAPSTEAEARRARYDFLEEVRRAEGARWVITAHHADDQAETVLFRAVRGTGIAGLQGIRARRRPALWRPLLPFTRAELTDYARSVGLAWRDDPTNEAQAEGAAPARSVIRTRILPEMEARVAPGASGALAALARRARENEAAWKSVLPGLLDGLDVRREGPLISLSRAAFVTHHPGVRARLLRELSARLGAHPGEAGTRAAVEFTSCGSSGSAVPLGGGLELRIELGRLVLQGRGVPTGGEPLVIPGSQAGRGDVVVGGCRYRVGWGPRPEDLTWSEAFDVADLRFPLSVRGWTPGDRARMAYGTKKLKKLFLEARVPAAERRRRPVLVDCEGAVLWVPGVARSTAAPARGSGELLHIGMG
jgi:tRNA(Ile)-lysidine synthase